MSKTLTPNLPHSRQNKLPHSTGTMRFLTVSTCLLALLSSSLSQDDDDCLCPNAQLVPDYVWLESQTYGFAPNATCADIADTVTHQWGCPDPGGLREICCVDSTRPWYLCAQNVRNTILKNDPFTVPVSSAVHDRLNVTVRLEYHAVTDIDIEAGTVEMFVWLTLTWQDARLAWTYDANTTCTTFPITVQASEIWVPDFDLYNRVSGTKTMGSLANVHDDGTVVWQRDGKLKAICNLKNLANIPFDELGCQFMFGSPTQSLVTYQLDPNGALVIGDFSSPYAEYTLVRAAPGVNVTDYGGYEIHHLFFDFYFARGTNYYIQTIILPVAIFSILSTCTMILGLTSFQRIALNLTLLLVAVAQKISISSLMPVTDQKLWLVDFVAYSFYWIASTILENIVVAAILAARKDYFEKLAETPGQNEEPGKATRGLELSEEELHQNTNDQDDPAWFYTFSLRSFDMACFSLSLTSYIIFIVVMVKSTDTWGRTLYNEFLWSNSSTTSS